MPREWNAASYDQIADPQQRWGAAVLERLDVAPDAHILDAGCGTGRVTGLLLERYPLASVIALDGSAAMLEGARRRLAVHSDRVEFVQADLGRPLPLAGRVDAVLSTATFHWVADHDALFANLAAVLVPGGHLVAQCGGRGNLASVKAILARTGDGWPGPTYYATAEETRHRLEAAGFTDVEAWLHDEPTEFPDRPTLEQFLATVALAPHLERLGDGATEDEKRSFVAAVVDQLDGLVLDYVRLNMVARRI